MSEQPILENTHLSRILFNLKGCCDKLEETLIYIKHEIDESGNSELRHEILLLLLNSYLTERSNYKEIEAYVARIKRNATP